MQRLHALVTTLSLAFVFAGCGGTTTVPHVDAGFCPATCSVDGECLRGSYCAAHTCIARSTYCIGTQWSANDRGELDDCGLYNCDPSTGRCKTTADTTDDCAVGALFDGQIGCTLPCLETDPNAQCTRYSGFRDEVAPTFETELACKAGCSRDSDCGAGMCFHGRCAGRGNYCDVSSSFGQVSVSVLAGAYDASGNLPRTVEVCAGKFACNSVTGECRSECIVTDHCQAVPCHTDTRACTP